MDRQQAIRMAGHKLAAGFEGTELPEEMIKLIKDYKVSNIILFARNVESEAQLKKLCFDIKHLVRQEAGVEALITIDQEGGSVSRLPSGCLLFPSQMAIAATAKPQNAYTASHCTGLLLRELGINFNLAPVMDLNINPKNPVIGTRSFGDNLSLASECGRLAIKGYQEAGILCSAKHFPGHGDTAVDSHVGLPVVDKSIDELWQTELKSFSSAIENGVPAVMVSHILYPQLQKNPQPATMSRSIITDLLRTEMGFDGLIISDCMMMEAISKYYGTVTGCKSSAKAGMDLIFVSHDPKLAAQAAEAIANLLLTGEIDEAEALASEQRILKAKKFVETIGLSNLSGDKQMDCRNQASAMAREALCLVNIDADSLPPLGKNPLVIGRGSKRASIAADEANEQLHFAKKISKSTGGEAFVLNEDLNRNSITAILEIAKEHSAFILSVQDNTLSGEETELMQKLLKFHRPLICVALRTPYPLAELPKGVIGIAAFDYTADSLGAVSLALAGQYKPEGKLPVSLGLG